MTRIYKATDLRYLTSNKTTSLIKFSVPFEEMRIKETCTKFFGEPAEELVGTHSKTRIDIHWEMSSFEKTKFVLLMPDLGQTLSAMSNSTFDLLLI